MRKFVALLCVCSLVAVVGVSPAAAAPGNNSNQVGLVNVSLGDVALLNNVNLGVAANVAATVCNVAVPVAVLAQQVIAGGGTYSCNTTTEPITIEQAQRDPIGLGGGGNNSHQSGLVNVSTGDVAILNNVNLAVAANVAATLCNITVPVAVLAVQVLAAPGEFTCTTATGPLSITQAQ